jgi:hypothetical protein
LIVENELTSLSERRERWPEEVVVEQQSAIYTHKRYCTGHLRGEVHGELEAACTNGAP